MSASKVQLPELPFYELNTGEYQKPTVQNRTQRSKDSEGKFTVDPPFPTHAEFVETERRREMSVATMLRMKDEEIAKLKKQLEKALYNG